MATTDVDLRGRTVGDLTLVAPTDQRDQSGSIIWVARCKCGAEQLRSAPYLRLALASGRKCACPRCLRGRRVVAHEARAEARMDRLLSIVERCDPAALGSANRTQAWLRSVLDWCGLYGLQYDAVEVAALRSECSDALGETLGAPSECLARLPGMETETASGHDAGQLWSNLYPMQAPADHGYLCAQCGATRERGWGCAQCVVFICYECGASESHDCSETRDGGATLREAAHRMGVCAERVRQIEGKAFSVVRQTWQRQEADAAVKRRTARAASLACIPNPALQERWEEQLRAIDEAARRAASARATKASVRTARSAAQEAQRLWMERSDEYEQVIAKLRSEMLRQVAVYAVGSPSELPWALRHPALPGLQFGNATFVATSPDGLYSCVSCRVIVVAGTAEARAHERGDCTFAFDPPEPVVARVRAELGLTPPVIDSGDSGR